VLTIFGEACSLEGLKAGWPALWETSKKNNPYLKTDPFSVTVFPITYGRYIAGYKALLVLRGGRKTYTRAYPTVERPPKRLPSMSCLASSGYADMCSHHHHQT
jgi:hypothetical protein